MVHRTYQFALSIFLLFHVGLIAELMLIGHYESFWQFFPLISLGFGVMSLFFLKELRRAETVRPIYSRSLVVVKFCYLLTMMAGVLGVFLHLKSNWEFESEMYTGLGIGELFIRSLSGAIPALAPGTLIPIGLMGFLLIQLKTKNQSQ